MTGATIRAPLCEYADPFDSYAAAIADARRRGLLICKYADPTEGERLDLTDEEAAEVGCQDLGLLYVAGRNGGAP